MPDGLIAGIGPIVGGAILKSGRSVQGIATAASIWDVGVAGGAAGHGLHDNAAVLDVVDRATLRSLLPSIRATAEADTRPSWPTRATRPDHRCPGRRGSPLR